MHGGVGGIWFFDPAIPGTPFAKSSGVPPFVKTFTMRMPELQFPLGISFILKINSILKVEANCLLT